jgi:hypothetical protein
MLVTTCKPALGCKQLLVVGQKSGIAWVLRPDMGVIDWWTQAGPGGVLGGFMWGSTSDGVSMHSSNNFPHEPFDLADGAQGGAKHAATAVVATGGMLVAMDAWDGAIQW